MKHLRLISFFGFAIFELCLGGCAKRMMSYEEAQVHFKVGMQMPEVEKTFGPPTLKFDAKNCILWSYTPVEDLRKGHDMNAFQVVFQDGRAVKIELVYVTAK